MASSPGPFAFRDRAHGGPPVEGGRRGQGVDGRGGGAARDRRTRARSCRGRPRRFAPRLAFATGFGPEGCVLIDLIARPPPAGRRLHARHRPALPRDLRRSGGGSRSATASTIRAVRPGADRRRRRRAPTASASGSATPDRCCALRKVAPLARRPAGQRRLDQRHPPRPDARRAPTRACSSTTPRTAWSRSTRSRPGRATRSGTTCARTTCP